MSLIRAVMLVLPSVSLGAVLMGSLGLPLAYRRGRKRTEDEVYVEKGLLLIREHKPLAITATPPVHPPVEEALPAQFGTRAEHGRRLELTAPVREARTVTALAYRRAQASLALDRAMAVVRTSHGRHRAEDIGPRLYGTVAQRRHSRAEEQQRIHLAWTTSTSEWPTVVEREGWQVGELVSTT